MRRCGCFNADRRISAVRSLRFSIPKSSQQATGRSSKTIRPALPEPLGQHVKSGYSNPDKPASTRTSSALVPHQFRTNFALIPHQSRPAICYGRLTNDSHESDIENCTTVRNVFRQLFGILFIGQIKTVSLTEQRLRNCQASHIHSL